MTTSGGEVVVVGDILVDILVVPDGPLSHASDTSASIRSAGGGSAANTATWLAASGVAVRFVGAVGDDLLGRAARDDLEAAGARYAGTVDPARPTGSCVVLIDQTGERTMLPDRGANDGLDPSAVTAALSHGTAWLHLSGYALLGEGSRAAGRQALADAHRLGIPTSVDASSAAPLRALGADQFLEWIDGCTLLLANDDEVAALGGTDPILAHCRQLATKHGPAGATWTDGTSTETCPAVPTTVVDTVGAGDAFNAGMITALVRGSSPAEALEAGTALAARAVATPGARPSP